MIGLLMGCAQSNERALVFCFLFFSVCPLVPIIYNVCILVYHFLGVINIFSNIARKIVMIIMESCRFEILEAILCLYLTRL